MRCDASRSVAGQETVPMAGRRLSGRRTSMSPAARKILKGRQKRRRHGLEPAEAQPSTTVLWVLVALGLVVVTVVIASILARG